MRQTGAYLPLTDNLSYRLSMLNFLMAKATRDIYAAHGLTSHQWKVLSVLHAAQPMPAREIAKRVTLDKAAISRAVRELRDSGLADTAPHPNDARIVNIVMTAKGKRLYERMNARIAALQTRLFGELSPAKRATFFGVMDALESRLRTEPAGSA